MVAVVVVMGGGSGAAYWNVFVVSSHPGYSTFRATPIISVQQAA